jgi:hypothetical protein
MPLIKLHHLACGLPHSQASATVLEAEQRLLQAHISVGKPPAYNRVDSLCLLLKDLLQ